MDPDAAAVLGATVLAALAAGEADSVAEAFVTADGDPTCAGELLWAGRSAIAMVERQLTASADTARHDTATAMTARRRTGIRYACRPLTAMVAELSSRPTVSPR
jgi:hypothetical protein